MAQALGVDAVRAARIADRRSAGRRPTAYQSSDAGSGDAIWLGTAPDRVRILSTLELFTSCHWHYRMAVEGGPGYPSTGSRAGYLTLFAPLLESYDVLLVDNRGTGKSQALDCEPLQNDGNGNLNDIAL